MALRLPSRRLGRVSDPAAGHVLVLIVSGGRHFMRLSWEGICWASLKTILLRFKHPGCSLSPSQEPSTVRYPKPDESS